MTTGDEPSNAAGSAASTDGGDMPRRSIVRTLIKVILVASVFAVALGGSWLVRKATTKDAAPDSHAENKPKARRKNVAGGSTTEILARGDHALLNFRFADALSAYTELVEGDSASAPFVDYRVGLCNESLAKHEKAIAAYRRAITATSSPILSFACHLAIARCLLQDNHPLEARQALYPVLLNLGKQTGLPAEFLSEARYLVALAFARETHATIADSRMLDRLAYFTEVKTEIPLYLAEIAKRADKDKDAIQESSAAIVVQKRTEKQPAMAVHVEQFDKPAKEILVKLASDAGWRIESSAAADKILEDRVANLMVRNGTLLELFEWTADSFDLVCRFEADVIYLNSRAEINQEKSASMRRETAQRALKSAISADPDHGLAAAAHLEIGNCLVSSDDAKEAMNWYERTLQDEPHSPYAILARYNCVQLHLRKQEYASARRDLFRVIDHGPGHEYALRAYLRLGQLCLEQEDYREATEFLRRAQVRSLESTYQPLTALNLAAAYVITKKPDQARAVLDKNRRALHSEPYSSSAAFLDAYIRYQLAKANSPARVEATELLTTLFHTQNNTVLGPIGRFLTAQAYDDLGFWDQAEQLLRQAAKVIPSQSPFSLSLDYKLGVALLKQNQFENAKPLFEKVAASSSIYRVPARFQLARLDLVANRWDECVERCRQLWQEKTYEEPLQILQLWGSALEGMGDHTRAAQCFAGKAPD